MTNLKVSQDENIYILKMKKNKIDLTDLINFFYSNNLLCLIGENMSGKSTLLKELRTNLNSLANKDNIFALHVDTPLNRMYFNTPNNTNAIELRLDDISNIIDRLSLFQNDKLFNIDNVYNSICQNVNKVLKEKFGIKSILSVEDKPKKDIEIRRNIYIILKKMLNIKDINDIQNQELIEKFRENIENEISNSISTLGFVSQKTKISEKKFSVKFNDFEYQKLTKISSGLQTLILTVFMIETVEYFLSQIKSIEFWLFFDEPECYLHPTWQKQLLNYFSTKSNHRLKILYATHSQYIIPIENLDNIGIVKNQNNNIKFETLKTLISNIYSNKTINGKEISVIKPVEDALGVKLDTFSLSFITVEGKEELNLLNKCLEDINVNKIINLKGADNILPYIQAANLYGESFKGVFILDADLELDRFIKSISNKASLINQIKQHFIFIGRKLYSFDELYTLGINGYEKNRNINECLEDYIASHLFENADVGYIKIKDLAKFTVSTFQNDDDKDIDIGDFEICINSFDKTKNFLDLISGCFKKISYKPDAGLTIKEQKNKNDKLREQLAIFLKHRITKEALKIDNVRYKELIDRIKSKI